MESAIETTKESNIKMRIQSLASKPGFFPAVLRAGRNLAVGCMLLALGTVPLAAQEEMVPTKPSNEKPTLINPQTAWGPDYTNWVEVSVGGFIPSGSKAELQRRFELPATAFGGIESLHVEQPLGSNGLFQIDGRGIFDNHDYDLRLDYTDQQKGFLRGGFREFREYYDVSGGYFPPINLWIVPFDREAAIDRGEAWFEAGLRRPDVPELTFRYSHQFRTGIKDSTSWGDISTPLGTRNIVPNFWNMDEKRDLFQLDVKHTISETELGGGVSYEQISQQDQRLILRQPGQPIERYVIQPANADVDLFNVHAYTATPIHDRMLLTAGYAFTMIDTDPSGDRIYDPTSRGQRFDEGFLDLSGSIMYHEHLFNLNLLLTPWENVSIIPAVRVAKEDESGNSAWIGTDFSGPAAFTPPVSSSGINDRDYLDVAESLEVRYTGLTNWLWYVRGEWSEDDGNLSQLELPALDQLDEDEDRFTQKYLLGLNWYPLQRMNLGAQYYHKIRDYTYDNRLPGPPPTDYPGFIRDQDFDMDDVNFRLTLRPLNSMTLVTRYDFQFATVETAGNIQDLGVAEDQSAKTVSHIISQSACWSPLPRLFLQGDFSYVLDYTHTPANDLTGAATELVLESQNNYWNVSVLVGYALNEKTDLQFQYYYYRADDYVDNAAFSQPYGAGGEENGVTVTLIRQISRSLRWTLKYGYFTNHDQTYGGHYDYNAHLVYSSLQYRF